MKLEKLIGSLALAGSLIAATPNPSHAQEAHSPSNTTKPSDNSHSSNSEEHGAKTYFVLSEASTSGHVISDDRKGILHETEVGFKAIHGIKKGLELEGELATSRIDLGHVHPLNPHVHAEYRGNKVILPKAGAGIGYEFFQKGGYSLKGEAAALRTFGGDELSLVSALARVVAGVHYGHVNATVSAGKYHDNITTKETIDFHGNKGFIEKRFTDNIYKIQTGASYSLPTGKIGAIFSFTKNGRDGLAIFYEISPKHKSSN